MQALAPNTLFVKFSFFLFRLSEVRASSRTNCSSMSCEVPRLIAQSVK